MMREEHFRCKIVICFVEEIDILFDTELIAQFCDGNWRRAPTGVVGASAPYNDIERRHLPNPMFMLTKFQCRKRKQKSHSQSRTHHQNCIFGKAFALLC